MANLSRAALLEFMDYLSKKGLMNSTTAAARKAAVNRVLGVLDESEASDVSKVDIDDAMRRFHNLEGSGFTPQSLNTYKSRLKASIDDFLRYQRDPLNFRPALQSSPRKTEPKASKDEEEPKRSASRDETEAPPAAVNIIPIPLRPDLTIKIQGLPFDLTASEANKIANVIKALASSD